MPEPFGHLSWRQAAGRDRRPAGAVRATSPDEAAASEASLVSRLTYLVVGLYTLTFAILSILQHNSYNTNAFDLGNYDQAIWNTAQGRPFEFTNWSGATTRLAAHVEPILLFIAPLYKVYPDPRLLLALQSLIMGLGALPAFWLAREKLRNDFAAVTFAAAYLLAPALEMANLADFHPVSLASSFLLFAFYFLYRGRYLTFFLFALLAMTTKEQVPVAVGLMGLYILFVRRNRAWGVVTVAVAALWFGVAFLWVIPHFNPTRASPYLSRYDHLGATPWEIMANLVTNPGHVLASLADPVKVAYLRSLFEPVAYLSLLSPLTLVFLLPDLAMNLLSNFPDMYKGQAHYGAIVAPFVIVSAVYGVHLPARLLSRLSPRLGQGFLYIAAALVLFFSLRTYYNAVFLPLADHLPSVNTRNHLAEELMAQIPPEAGVSASSSLNPHVSQRRRLYLFPEIKDADYIFLDVTANPYPIDAAETEWRIRELLLGGQWGVVAAQDGYLLLRRGAANAALPPEFFTFTRAKASEVPHPVSAIFGDALELVGYDLHPGEVLHGVEPHAKVSLFFRAARPIGEDYLPVLYVIDIAGEVRSTQGFAPAALWYPTHRWAEGELVRLDYSWVPLEGRPWGEVWLGVVAGKDPNNRGALLPAAPAEPGRHNLNGNLIKLMELRAG